MQKLLFSSLLLLGLSGWFPLIAQHIDYHHADSVARSLQGARHLTPEQLALQLTENLPTQHEKARAIFRWITANIAYDQKEYEQLEKSGFAPIRKQFRSPAQQKKWVGRRYMKKVNSAMRKRKAVCEGYAMLFKHLCSWANIEAEVVSGHSRSYGDKIGKYKRPLHAWNAVKLDGSWYLLDATWAAGHTAELSRRFVFNFREYYFLTPPEQFISDHYPEKEEWLLLTQAPSVKAFYKQPLPLQGFFSNGISAMGLQEGLIRAEPGETVALRFRAQKEIIGDVLVYREAKARPTGRALPSEVSKIGEQDWEVRVCFPEKGTYRFVLYVNESASLLYQASIR